MYDFIKVAPLLQHTLYKYCRKVVPNTVAEVKLVALAGFFVFQLDDWAGSMIRSPSSCPFPLTAWRCVLHLAASCCRFRMQVANSASSKTASDHHASLTAFIQTKTFVRLHLLPFAAENMWVVKPFLNYIILQFLLLLLLFYVS